MEKFGSPGLLARSRPGSCQQVKGLPGPDSAALRATKKEERKPLLISCFLDSLESVIVVRQRRIVVDVLPEFGFCLIRGICFYLTLTRKIYVIGAHCINSFLYFISLIVNLIPFPQSILRKAPSMKPKSQIPSNR